MTTRQLTLQTYVDHEWKDSAALTFPDPEQGRLGVCEMEYLFDYAFEYLHQDKHEAAFSLRYPVQMYEPHNQQPWFATIDDIIPAGAARRFWIRNLGMENLPATEQDYPLLATGTIAPIGNMRIKEALPLINDGEKIDTILFPLDDAISRSSDFLQYANQMGAVGGGATGAGGEAPKFLVRYTPDDKVWIDAYQDDADNTDEHYLVKFARNRGSAVDKDILRAEYHYYQVLSDLGINTIDTGKMKLFDDGDKVSLWLPRFDVGIEDGKLVHYGMESVFSALAQPPGSNLKHLNVVVELVTLLNQHDKRFNPQTFVNEWVRRDFLNVVFGNSDNHGRNTAFLKRPGQPVVLSPVYDFAPMKADPEGVIRTTTWGPDAGLEVGGNFDWIAIAFETEQALSRSGFNISADSVIDELSKLASQLLDLKPRLLDQGVPESIANMPAFGFGFLNEKLKRWDLV
ncbi:type II toxin-antitoxin system HipA family toxin [Endozoicomonas lisbonensis]|uniref:Serine/threonine-protein kinase HipA n=1 Tax=Endozoicomonas lisbonensis TaxID=3120522 RepID=A0ABV2SAR0_9GAMM